MFKQLYSKVVSTICTDNIARINQKIYLMFHSIEGEMSNNNSIYHLPVIRFREICKFLDDIRIEAQNDYGNSIEIINETFIDHLSNNGIIIFSSNYEPDLENLDIISLN